MRGKRDREIEKFEKKADLKRGMEKRIFNGMITSVCRVFKPAIDVNIIILLIKLLISILLSFNIFILIKLNIS